MCIVHFNQFPTELFLILKSKSFNFFKGTVSVISREKDGNAKLKMVPFKAFWSSKNFLGMFLLQKTY